MATEIEIEFDPAKDAKNLAKHGVSLAAAVDFDWATARIEEDVRFFMEKSGLRPRGGWESVCMWSFSALEVIKPA